MSDVPAADALVDPVDTWKEHWERGEIAWFEYHCYEGHDSVDAELWYRSHQQVVVLSRGPDDAWEGSTIAERGAAGQPKAYEIRFADGFTASATEDELHTHPAGWQRPNPPPRPAAISATPSADPPATPSR